MPNPIDSMAMAIFMFEGGNEASPIVRNVRNNNPGNLRPLNPDQKADGNYRVFDTFAEGWQALVNDISFKLKYHLTKDKTLLDFLNLYAPAGDHNNPSEYAKFVAHFMSLGQSKIITVATPLGAIFAL